MNVKEDTILTQAYQHAEAIQNCTRWNPQDIPVSREAYDLIVQINALAGQIIAAVDAYDGEPEEEGDHA